jgi:hypothetical protein
MIAQTEQLLHDVLFHELEVHNLTAEELAAMSDIPVKRMQRNMADCGSFTLPQICRMSIEMGMGRVGLLEQWAQAMADAKELEAAANLPQGTEAVA